MAGVVDPHIARYTTVTVKISMSTNTTPTHQGEDVQKESHDFEMHRRDLEFVSGLNASSSLSSHTMKTGSLCFFPSSPECTPTLAATKQEQSLVTRALLYSFVKCYVMEDLVSNPS